MGSDALSGKRLVERRVKAGVSFLHQRSRVMVIIVILKGGKGDQEIARVRKTNNRFAVNY